MDITTISRSALLFLMAGICEIGGGYLVWLWLRDSRAIWIGALGGLILFVYGIMPTLQPHTFTFGRIYAAYGGAFIVLALLWAWWLEGQKPDRYDLLGAAVALTGAAIIIYAPRS